MGVKNKVNMGDVGLFPHKEIPHALNFKQLSGHYSISLMSDFSLRTFG
jgi:hypothetical protein